MQIRLLGGVGAVTDDGEQLDVGPPKCQEVLAALALSAGSSVPVTRLLELVWGSDPPRTAEKTLQTYIARLRKSLGQQTIARTGAAYRLDVEPESVDALRFQGALEDGAVDRALEIWTGPPLAGLDAGGLRAASERLLEGWLGAVEASLGEEVERDPAGAVPALTELIADHPFREGLWALLMIGLYRVGRQADALAAYARAREHLITELGVEPGVQLRELEASILNHDAALAVQPGLRPGSDTAVDDSDNRQSARPPNGTVTFAFCTAVVDRQSTQDAALTSAARAAAERFVRAAATERGGFTFARGGGTVGVAFHGARDAADWGIAISSLLATERGSSELDVQAKIGLHTGDVEHRDGNYVGPTVDFAAGLAAAAHPRQILLSGTTAALLDEPHRSELADLGHHRLDGLEAGGHLWQLGSNTFPPLDTVAAPRRNLPVPSTALFGREADILRVVELLDNHRLVTLTGVGGAGKTRLALAVAETAAERYPDGVFFASLAPIDHRDQIGRVVGAALGLTVGSFDHASIAEFLGSRRLLLVIDNCEQVIDGVAELVSDALEAGSRSRILATSRERLEVDGEWTHSVAPLPTVSFDSAGVQLLADRARQVRPGLEVDGASRKAFIEISSRLDGIPLALELAAAQLTHLTPAELATRLDDRFRLLIGQSRGRLPQHQTLQTTMDWSWDLLTPDERQVLQQLSVFAGGWTLPAAEGICLYSSDTALTVILRALVAKSLVSVEVDGDTTRYRMLETVRLYGQHKLTEAGEDETVRDRHARYFCAAADSISLADRFMEPSLGVAWAREVDNIAAVVDWLRERDRLVECAALLTMPALLWRFQPAPEPIRLSIRELLASALGPKERYVLLIAGLDAGTGRTSLSARGSRAHEVVELGRGGGDDAAQSIGLILEGSPLGAVDPDRAEMLLTESVERGDSLGDQRLVAMGLAMLGGVQAFGRRDLGEARSLLDQAESIATPEGFERLAILDQRLTLEIMAGDWTAGFDAYRQLLAFHEATRLPLNWHDAIDDAVFAGQLGSHRQQPLATALERLRAAGGNPLDWPDLLVIPLGEACALNDWDRAARAMMAIRESARSGRPLSSPHATAYYLHFRERVPRTALEHAPADPSSRVLEDELAREATIPTSSIHR